MRSTSLDSTTSCAFRGIIQPTSRLCIGSSLQYQRYVGPVYALLRLFDDTCDLVSVPYVIYERVPGQTLASLELDTRRAAGVWRELGRDLARVHAVNAGDLTAAVPVQEVLPDPREMVETRSTEGWFTSDEARWLRTWLDRLAPMTRSPAPGRLLHGDSQATIVMVNVSPLSYLAVIGWGATAWGDATNDFAHQRWPARRVDS
jgi:hygromycin-B 7''-O-kinase